MSQGLRQYRGKLNADEIAEGINAANRNAQQLTEDASILFEAERYPRAAALAILAIEESGKGGLLRRIAVVRDSEELKQCWRDYHRHTSKNMQWPLPQLVAEGAQKLEDFRSLFSQSSDHPRLLEHVKQISFYSDCYGDKHWSEPRVVIDKELAEILLQTSRILTTRSNVSCEEIELWITHLGPVWNTTTQQMKNGLVNWYRAMQQRHLKPDGPNRMERFIYEGLLAQHGTEN